MQAARAVGDSLGVGLHLTLTVGRPLTRAESLVDPVTGEFLSPSRLVKRVLAGRIRGDEVLAECRAQIARARNGGLTLTHLDGHLHVHLLPGIVGAVRQAIISERILAVRGSTERLFGRPMWMRRLPERVLMKGLTSAARLRRWPVRTTDHFIGSALLGAKDFERRLIAELDRLPPGTTELMVHPGYARAPLPGNDQYVAQREVELRALLCPAVLDRLHSGRIHLVHYGDLAQRPSSLGGRY
jgi:predicted glycoside hydrolase/deacetylase ChbG (UPF0249 family)